MGALRFIDELLIEMMGRDRAHFFGKSGDERPTEGLKVGDEYEEVDTGDRFIWYDERWHLKEAGTYSAIKFTLTFDKGDASAVSVPSKEVTYDSTYGELATTTYEGYQLDGWFFNAGLTDKVSAEDTVLIEANTTVYPKHSPIDYDITYTLNGGTNGDNPATYNIETPEITLDAPTKDGYVFDGWYGAEDFSGDAVTKIALGSIGAKTLYAKWVADTFGITYTLNGGTNAGANPATYTIETATIELADATKDGYTFAGWFSDTGLTTEVTEIVFGSFGDITLYAGWTAIDYTVTYELYGGVNGANPATYDIEDAVTLVAATKEGYTFGGWYAEVGLTTPVTGWAVGTTGAKTVYAKWIQNYTVTFNSNGGSTVTAQEVVNGGLATKPADPTKTDHVFDGWYTDDGAWTDAFNFASEVIAVDTTLYAKWLELFTVTFDTNDGSTVESQEVADGEYATEPSEPTKDGFTFGGWYTDNGTFADGWTFASDAVQWNITLYAKWGSV